MLPAITDNDGQLGGRSWTGCPELNHVPIRDKSTFSHHLRILREAGLVTKRIQGARGYARLRWDDVDRLPGSSTPTLRPGSDRHTARVQAFSTRYWLQSVPRPIRTPSVP